MSRDKELLTPEYKAKNLAKINAMRRAESMIGIADVLMTKGQLLFSPATERRQQPASCYNCHMMNAQDETCMIHGKGIYVKKFTYGSPDKNIEYWPCCSYHSFGEPNREEAKYIKVSDPDYTGLVWINAPKLGQEYGGANCGGRNGGDDCDFYDVTGFQRENSGDYWRDQTKRAYPEGKCKLLGSVVSSLDVCSGWQDDDQLSWQAAQSIMEELEEQSTGDDDE